MLLAAFDIGGTSVKYGIVTNRGTLLYKGSTPTEPKQGGMKIIQKVSSLANQMKKKWNIAGIAISSAGQINYRDGSVVYATEGIPNYSGINIAEEIRGQTHLTVRVENDANCMALGEYWMGVAKKRSNFLCITIGTGIGGALFLNGRLYRGENFSSGEVGHINLYPGGKDCTCGSYGCYEKYASSRALEGKIKERLNININLVEFFKQTIEQEQSVYLEILQEWVNDLTTGLKSIIHIINPSLIVIGGGVSAQGDFLLEQIRSSLYPKLMPNHNVEIKMAYNNNDANLLGAAYHYFKYQRR